MGMVVRTNTMALNAYRQLGMNNSAVAKSLEKLSSGFRINRAGDDAAGLAISEKMKAQITGLETASANAQDGISLIQTAEGNLSEVHDMLNRMVELASKSANGTYTTTERKALQDEMDQLLDEIDRISQSANFNGTKLLDGTMGLNQSAFKVGAIVDGSTGDKITLAGLPTTTAGIAAGGPAHLNTPGSTPQQGGAFTLDLADYELDLTGATADDVEVTFGIQGKQMVLHIDGSQADNQRVWTGEDIVDALYAAGPAGTGHGIWVTDANKPGGAANTEVYAAINKAFYKVTKDGTKLTFTYAGDTANGNNATENDAITADMLAADDKADKTVTVTATGTGVKGSGSSYHGVLDITEMKMAVDGERAGITFDMAANPDLFTNGSQLTIDGKTFTFKTDANSNVTGENVIDLTDVKGTGGAAPTTEEYAKAAARKLSNYNTDHFVISDGGNGKLKVDQSVEDYDGGKNAPYTTLESLTGLFSAKKADVAPGVKLTVTDKSIINGDAITVGDKTYKFVDTKSAKPASGVTEVLKSDGAAGLKKALEADGFTVDGEDTLTISKYGDTKAPFIIGGGLTLQIGDTADSFNKMNVAVADMSAKGLGLDDLKNTGIMTENSASAAIDTIKNAINTVSSTRAGMGALQNRLEHTINNLDVAAENLSAANSRIRDTDMAKEMMNYTKMNVLVQSAQAMLAQANQQPQSVLQLLQ